MKLPSDGHANGITSNISRGKEVVYPLLINRSYGGLFVDWLIECKSIDFSQTTFDIATIILIYWLWFSFLRDLQKLFILVRSPIKHGSIYSWG